MLIVLISMVLLDALLFFLGSLYELIKRTSPKHDWMYVLMILWYGTIIAISIYTLIGIK
jgi:hypothetical protein